MFGKRRVAPHSNPTNTTRSFFSFEADWGVDRPPASGCVIVRLPLFFASILVSFFESPLANERISSPRGKPDSMSGGARQRTAPDDGVRLRVGGAYQPQQGRFRTLINAYLIICSPHLEVVKPGLFHVKIFGNVNQPAGEL